MKIETKWNHELGPSERAMVDSLSGGQAVGAFIAVDGDAFYVRPVGAPEFLYGDSEERNLYLSDFESDAKAEFKRLRTP